MARLLCPWLEPEAVERGVKLMQARLGALGSLLQAERSLESRHAASIA
jgi:hypothetical protein